MSSVLTPATNLSASAQARAFLLRHGFKVVLVLMFSYFSLSANHFSDPGNLISMAHAMVPMVVLAAGLGLVVIAGQLDISVGSVSFLSSAIGVILMSRYGLDPLSGCVLIIALGALLGAINGFIVVVMGVNALIATLGTMIAFRGAALQITQSWTIELPGNLRGIGNLTLGPFFYDIIVAIILVYCVHRLHRSTAFGRQVTAIGDSIDAAKRRGLPVKRVQFLNFILCGTLASIAGLLSVFQIGSVTAFMGLGQEFSAVAVVVVGGISLFGGRGTILSGVLLGALVFEMIRNGLNHMGADPYSYRVISGAVIFLAMYADALRSKLNIKRALSGDP